MAFLEINVLATLVIVKKQYFTPDILIIRYFVDSCGIQI